MGMGTHGGGNPWIQMHNTSVIVVYKYISILLYGMLFTIHTALDVAPSKLLVPRPEIVSASSSIPVPAKQSCWHSMVFCVLVVWGWLM